MVEDTENKEQEEALSVEILEREKFSQDFFFCSKNNIEIKIINLDEIFN